MRPFKPADAIRAVQITSRFPSDDGYRLIVQRDGSLEERFVCTVYGHRGADVRPLFEPARMCADS